MKKGIEEFYAKVKDKLKSNDITKFSLHNIYKLFYILYQKLANHVKDIKVNIRKSGINNFKLGLLFLKQKKISDARLRFWLAVKFVPDSSAANYYLGYVYFLENKTNKALKYLNRALSTRDDFCKRAEVLINRISDFAIKRQ